MLSPDKKPNWLLVLGASSDIARPLYHLFAAYGFSLYLADPDSAPLAAEQALIKEKHGVDVRLIDWDVLYFNGHEKFFSRLDPAPQGVVCAVGYFGDEPRARNDMEEAARIVQINLFGPISMLNIAAAAFEKRGSGFIIGISSCAGDKVLPAMHLYGSAKAGFSGYLCGLRNRLFKSGVRVITAKPGLAATKMTAPYDHPQWMLASPDKVANDIFSAWRKGRDIVYSPWWWKAVAAFYMHLPEWAFKRLKG